jgi:hypothetical protein
VADQLVDLDGVGRHERQETTENDHKILAVQHAAQRLNPIRHRLPQSISTCLELYTLLDRYEYEYKMLFTAKAQSAQRKSNRQMKVAFDE